jgi:hypothetical protein
MMEKFLTVSCVLVFLLSGCGAADPVSLQIPFTGALQDSSRVVIADGAPIGGTSSLQLALKSQQVNPSFTTFSLVDSNGNGVGEVELGPISEPVESTLILDGIRRDHYTMTVRFMIEGDVVSGDMECFDFLHPDDTIDVASFGPPVEGKELRSGMCSGRCLFGDGTFLNAPNNGLMTGKFVAISQLIDGKKTFFHTLQWPWVIDR